MATHEPTPRAAPEGASDAAPTAAPVTAVGEPSEITGVTVEFLTGDPGEGLPSCGVLHVQWTAGARASIELEHDALWQLARALEQAASQCAWADWDWLEATGRGGARHLLRNTSRTVPDEELRVAAALCGARPGVPGRYRSEWALTPKRKVYAPGPKSTLPKRYQGSDVCRSCYRVYEKGVREGKWS